MKDGTRVDPLNGYFSFQDEDDTSSQVENLPVSEVGDEQEKSQVNPNLLGDKEPADVMGKGTERTCGSGGPIAPETV